MSRLFYDFFKYNCWFSFSQQIWNVTIAGLVVTGQCPDLVWQFYRCENSALWTSMLFCSRTIQLFSKRRYAVNMTPVPPHHVRGLRFTLCLLGTWTSSLRPRKSSAWWIGLTNLCMEAFLESPARPSSSQVETKLLSLWHGATGM